jgi:Na+/proline symporter
VIALSYASLSGLWGVVATDLFQFVVATGGVIVLAVLSVKHVGGVGHMVDHLRGLTEWEGHNLSIWPVPTPSMSWTLIGAYFGLQWIAGANPLLFSSQRVLACRSDRDTSLAVLWNVLARHVLNTWPWITVALCSLIVFPALQDHQMAYPKMVTTLLPVGLRGLMLAAILAAFMSSVDTLLNWGSSYVVNDIYRPFIVRSASERHYVWVSRLSMCAVAAVGIIFGLRFKSIIDRLQFAAGMIISFSPVLVLRWFWWRINAWSEISAVAAAAVVSIVIDLCATGWSGTEYFGHRLITSMALTAAVWLTVTFLTKPADMDTLKRFYRRVRPPGFWGPVKAQLEPHEIGSGEWGPWPGLVLSCITCAALIYSAIVGTGKFILGQWQQGLVFAAIAVVGWIVVRRQLSRMDEFSAQARHAEE